jgi:hypothetical protein
MASVNDTPTIYNRGTVTDSSGNSVEYISKMSDIKNGRDMKRVMAILIVASIFLMVACGIGIDKAPKRSTQHYMYITGCVISGLIFITCIIALTTVVKSLEIEDIMVTGIQRLSAGTMQIKDFQATAGNYFKKRLYKGVGQTALSNFSDQEMGRALGRNLLGM